MIDPDDLSADARRLLDAARNADDPAPSDRARIDAAVSNRLRALGIAAPPADAPFAGAQAKAAASATASNTTAYAGLNVAGKLVIGLIAAGMAVAGTRMASNHAPGGATNAARATTQSAPNGAGAEMPSRSATAAAAEPALPSHAGTALPAYTASSAGVATASHSPDAPPSATASPSPSAPSSPNAATSALRGGVAPRTRAASPRGATAPRAARTRPANDVTSVVNADPAVVTDRLREEVALIESANDALRQRHFVSALRLLDAHEARFAQGTLEEERRGLRVLALCGLGELAAGSEQRARFLRDAPHSVLVRQVAAACSAQADTAQHAKQLEP